MDYYEYYIVYSVVGLIIAAGLAFIPANIAKKKGYRIRYNIFRKKKIGTKK